MHNWSAYEREKVRERGTVVTCILCFLLITGVDNIKRWIDDGWMDVHDPALSLSLFLHQF